LWSVLKFGKKSLSAWRNIGFLFILWTDCLPLDKILGTKTHKKCHHIDNVEIGVLWLLPSSVKGQWTNFHSPPIKLLESFVLFTNNHSMKHPFDEIGLHKMVHNTLTCNHHCCELPKLLIYHTNITSLIVINSKNYNDITNFPE
jgi:hypothetical protein